MVTDASARVNESYRQMASRVKLAWLKDAEKTYRNMTIRIVPTAASRSVYRDKNGYRGRELIDMAVRYVESVPGEDLLVIGYKGRFNMKGVIQTTIEDAIRARLRPEDRARLNYIHYARRTATNAFKDCRHVLAFHFAAFWHGPTRLAMREATVGRRCQPLCAYQRGQPRTVIAGCTTRLPRRTGGQFSSLAGGVP